MPPLSIGIATALAGLTTATAIHAAPIEGQVLAPAANMSALTSSPSCLAAVGDRDHFRMDASQLNTRNTVSFEGGAWTVNLNNGWRQYNPSNASHTLAYYSGAWLIPTNASDLDSRVNTMIAWSKGMPDSGTQDGNAGWAESQTAKRIRVAVCLYELSGNSALIPAIEDLAAAVMDKNRYYGPPKFPVHNHGVMADRSLIWAGQALGKDSWINLAISRMKKQLRGSFDTCGMSYEQSSAYQEWNATLWESVADMMDSINPSFANSARRTATKARLAAQSMFHPDGTLPVIGDGEPKTVSPRPGKEMLTWCTRTGWGIQETVSGSDVQRLITRFGPGTAFHGHADKGSLIWWASRNGESIPVLSDRGLSGKDKDARREYSEGTQAHSTLDWAGGSNLKLSGRKKKTTQGSVFTLSGRTYKYGSWARTVTTSRADLTLKVSDKISGAGANMPARQLFTLEPGWVASGTNGVFQRGNWKLTISCTSLGKAQPIKVETVEHFLGYDASTSALTASCSAAPNAKSTLVESVLSLSRA